MKESNFVKWGTYKTSGEIRVCDPCMLKDKAKPTKVKIGPGTYEVLACSVEKHHKEYTDSGIIGIVLKKPNANLNFSKLKPVKGNFSETTKSVCLIEEKHFKTLDKVSAEDIGWTQLSKPKSKLLVGSEIKEYAWWEEVAIRDNFIVSNGKGYAGKLYVYQGVGILLILFYPFDADFTGYNFHKKKSDFFKLRASIIKKNLFERLDAWINLCAYDNKDKVKLKAEVVGDKKYGTEINKMIDDKINSLLKK